MVNNHPPIATPFNNFCPKTLSILAPSHREHRGDELLLLPSSIIPLFDYLASILSFNAYNY